MNHCRRRESEPGWTRLAIVVLLALAAGCAPARPTQRIRETLPPAASSARSPVVARPLAREARPLPQEANIREQTLKTPQPNLPADKQVEPLLQATPESPPLRDDSSMLAKITPATAPQRAASLRLTEEGRKILEAGDTPKALARLEQSIAIDSSNAYGYFYLAKAHHRLGRYQESLNFLDVAESRLSAEPFWLAEVHALRGENFRALDMAQQAEASYTQALRLNSGNRTAAEALSRSKTEGQSDLR